MRIGRLGRKQQLPRAKPCPPLGIYLFSRSVGQPVDPLLMGVEHGVGLRPGQLLSGLPDLRYLGEDPHPAAG
jgi:hypothetical protein